MTMDKLVSWYGNKKHDTLDSKYQPSRAIVAKRLLRPESRKLTVLFPPWHGADKPFRVLERRLTRLGSAVLSYDLHGQILSSDIQGVIDSFTRVQTTAVAEIDKLQQKYGYESVDLIGVSIGTLSMSLVARHYPAVSRVTSVVGASRLAPCVWNGIRTQPIRQQLEANGVTLDALESAWSELAPCLSAPALSSKPVRMYVSENDLFIPTLYQHELVATMRENGAFVDEHTSHLDHVLSILTFCAHGDLSAVT